MVVHFLLVIFCDFAVLFGVYAHYLRNGYLGLEDYIGITLVIGGTLVLVGMWLYFVLRECNWRFWKRKEYNMTCVRTYFPKEGMKAEVIHKKQEKVK